MSNHHEVTDWVSLDKQYVWHPYSAMNSELPVFPVVSATGTTIQLKDGRELIDGMSSWWCAIHGYNHPVLNQAITDQMQKMSHVMFGGLSHEPASRLAAKLVDLTPDGLETVFFSDSGSVAVEVSIKMAIQYWLSQSQPSKKALLTVRSGYHGDTFGAMSVSDPDTGMHHLFSTHVSQQYFVEAPQTAFDEVCREADLRDFKTCIEQRSDVLAAVIIEPIVQGAGGMRFYSPDYLKQVRALCTEFNVLLIVDEIATGFGRTGKLFASEHAGISPDILCVGKALTGGYLTLAATLTTHKISQSISQHDPGVFMHGPTFMANPLACAVANASIDLLLSSQWQKKVKTIELWLRGGLSVCENLSVVDDVRVLGAIGVVQLHSPVDMKVIQQAFVDKGVWIRPFGCLVYLMPSYMISEEEVHALTKAVHDVLNDYIPSI